LTANTHSGSGPPPARPGQHGKAAVPDRDQGTGQRPGARGVVGHDRVHTEERLADADGPAPLAAERGDLPGQRLPGRRIIGAAADQDHRAGALGAHERDVLPLGRLVGRGTGQADQELVRAGHVNEAGRDRGEVGIGDIVHDHADQAAAAGRDRPGLQVGGVAELGDGLVYSQRQLRPDPARPLVHHPRCGGDRDARTVGHVLQGHPRSGPTLTCHVGRISFRHGPLRMPSARPRCPPPGPRPLMGVPMGGLQHAHRYIHEPDFRG
jgi:hypothetical protein